MPKLRDIVKPGVPCKETFPWTALLTIMTLLLQRVANKLGVE